MANNKGTQASHIGQKLKHTIYIISCITVYYYIHHGCIIVQGYSHHACIIVYYYLLHGCIIIYYYLHHYRMYHRDHMTCTLYTAMDTSSPR